MTRVMLRHPYIRYRCDRIASMSLYFVYCRDRFALGNKKTFALTVVHPAYACEATTAKEPGRSQVAELEPWKSRPVGVPTIHEVQRHRRGDVA